MLRFICITAASESSSVFADWNYFITNAGPITHDATIHTPEYSRFRVVVMKPENKLCVYCFQHWRCFPSTAKRVVTKVEPLPKKAHNVSELHVEWRWFVKSPSYCRREGWRKRWRYGLQRRMQISPPIVLLRADPSGLDSYARNLHAFISVCRIWTSAISSLGIFSHLYLTSLLISVLAFTSVSLLQFPVAWFRKHPCRNVVHYK